MEVVRLEVTKLKISYNLLFISTYLIGKKKSILKTRYLNYFFPKILQCAEKGKNIIVIVLLYKLVVYYL